MPPSRAGQLVLPKGKHRSVALFDRRTGLGVGFAKAAHSNASGGSCSSTTNYAGGDASE